MNALFALRDCLLDADIGLQPEDVTLAVQGGRLHSWYRRTDERQGGHNRKFRLAYSAALWLLGTRAPIAAILYLITRWQDAYCPNHDANSIEIAIDYLDDDQYDLQITLGNLIQTYTPRVSDDGTRIDECPAPDSDPIMRTDDFETVIARDTYADPGDGDG